MVCAFVFFFQAEDGIRYLVRSRGLGDVYKRQLQRRPGVPVDGPGGAGGGGGGLRPDERGQAGEGPVSYTHLTLPTSDLV